MPATPRALFRFDVIVEGEVGPARGYLIDYSDIKTAAEPIVQRLDHYYLNEIEGRRIQPVRSLQSGYSIGLSRIFPSSARSSFTRPAHRRANIAASVDAHDPTYRACRALRAKFPMSRERSSARR